MARGGWLILASMLVGGAAATGSTEGPAGLAARGQGVFRDHCTPCHAGSRALRVAKGARGWTDTVDRMAGRYRRAFGQEILGGDREAAVAYLLSEAGSQEGP